MTVFLFVLFPDFIIGQFHADHGCHSDRTGSRGAGHVQVSAPIGHTAPPAPVIEEETIELLHDYCDVRDSVKKYADNFSWTLK